jgi:hypothetical protein
MAHGQGAAWPPMWGAHPVHNLRMCVALMTNGKACVCAASSLHVLSCWCIAGVLVAWAGDMANGHLPCSRQECAAWLPRM